MTLNSKPFRLLAVLAHPDDECLGIGGILARYASEGVEVSLLTATRGDKGRYRGYKASEPQHPGAVELARIRETELHAAAAVLGVREVSILNYYDQQLDRVEPAEVIGAIAAHMRRIQPDVVVTFGPDGAYGHPDHIAISQFTTAAIVAAANPDSSFQQDSARKTHAVAKLYYMAWTEQTWKVYETAFRKLVSMVDGVERQAVPWPDWAVTTVVDTREFCPTVLKAISCHESQVAAYEGLKSLQRSDHEVIWGWQSFYRAMSTVSGGREIETDLFEGIRK